MKNLIIIVGTLFLGCYIFFLIAGPDNSLKAASAGVLEQSIEFYRGIGQ